jgi:hypothetical protein
MNAGGHNRVDSDMNCLYPLKHWGCGFDAYWRHGCVCVYAVLVRSVSG